MTALRRTAVLIGLVAAVIVGTGIPASAAFSASEAVSTSIATATIEAPRNLSISVRCEGSELLATVSWTKSRSAGVDGYDVVATMNGDTMAFRAGANDGSYTHRMGRVWAAYAVPVRLTVTTDTKYGWTQASTPLNGTVTTC
jgi:hypothetical protein